MPALWRSTLRSALGSVTSMPATVIRPDCTFSSPLIQRNRVDLPDPERPMMAAISPFSRVSDTSFRTSIAPKDFLIFVSSTSGMESPFQPVAEFRKGEADDEIDGGDGEIDRKRREG